MDRSQTLDVQVVCTDQGPPVILAGTAARADLTSFDVTLKDGTGTLPDGSSVILDFADGRSPLVQGRVEGATEGRLRIRVLRTRERDQREFPRVTDSLKVRYLVLPSGTEEAVWTAWLEKGDFPDAAEWYRPSPLADLSASGLALDSEATCAAGDHLLVSLALEPGTPAWRCVARVVRVAPLTETQLRHGDAEAGATHRLSLELVALPDDARQAILERTIDLLRLPGEPPDR